MNTRTLGIGTFISIGSPVVTEIVSMMGFDWMLFDMEHGCINESNLLHNLQAVRDPDVKIIVRVREPDPTIISRVLDAGASGIMVPHVSTPGLAASVVDAMRYPPRGSRGFSTSVRAMGFGKHPVKDTLAWEPPLFLAQIESREGVEAAAHIAGVDGVDMLFVGPRDLSLDLSVRKDPMDFDLAIRMVAAAASEAGKQSGILVRNIADRAKFEGYGYTALAIGSDMGALKKGYEELKPKQL
ncbi:MAG: HpcH/HpaI aldolase/citrate lyase family protein [Candidatus Cryptobacteroides sp.]